MSFFENHTDEQLVALTDAQVNTAIDRTCAERGIPLWVEEIVEPKLPVAHDMTLFQVAGYKFEKQVDANRVAEAINDSPKWTEVYSWGRSNEGREWTQDERTVTVEIISGHRPETWHKHRAALDEFEDRKKRYEATKKANEQAYESRGGVAKEAWKEIRDARDRLADRDRLRNLYIRYIGLANGDKEVARKFLVAAEKFDEAWQPEPGWVA